MDETEPAQSPNEEYYQLSPLGFLGDSYFIQPNDEYQQREFSQFGGSVHLGLDVQYPGGVDYTATTSPFSLPANYQPYQSQHSMDLNVLSADNYREGVHAITNWNRQDEGGTQLYGGSVASSHRRRTPSPLQRNTRTRKNSRKDGSRGMPVEENSSRQRGRPRMDTRDQTAAEVRPSDSGTFISSSGPYAWSMFSLYCIPSCARVCIHGSIYDISDVSTRFRYSEVIVLTHLLIS